MIGNGTFPRPGPQGGATVAILLFAVLVLVGAYDLWAVLFGHQAATASYWVKRWSAEWPFVPFLAGLLAGHLFF